ncbi:XRE family transcriptional regulator [Oceanobacillus arenosus]|uniref:XRE family transcriptional regulator n=1 Tax=Oceanobacillus arenosus TaxID=1229153 RepID=A0A3D8PPI9_9BACI|nr:helix-turn-helix transcriptional regulator [Oceanobacillus arenosus]RDW18056.1 XRE family transcriptional regulator [Oceanobacillus arenosus]
MELKSRIGYWIEIRGYKKMWVAKQIGVSHVVLSRWINDVSIPSVVNLFKLAVLLDCKVDELYERSD